MAAPCQRGAAVPFVFRLGVAATEQPEAEKLPAGCSAESSPLFSFLPPLPSTFHFGRFKRLLPEISWDQT